MGDRMKYLLTWVGGEIGLKKAKQIIKLMAKGNQLKLFLWTQVKRKHDIMVFS